VSPTAQAPSMVSTVENEKDEKEAPALSNESREDTPELIVTFEPAGEDSPISLDAAACKNAPQEPEDEPRQDETDIDEFWSNLLDELKARHIPTFSLVSSHAFPISLEADTFSMGVMVETFQKMIENKADHVKGACQALLSRPVHVRVKVVDKVPPNP